MTEPLQAMLNELEQGQLPNAPAHGPTPPPLPPPRSAAEFRDGVLFHLRRVIGAYAAGLGYWRWCRKDLGEELVLRDHPRQMVNDLAKFSDDPVLGRALAESIVDRIGELVSHEERA